MKGGRKAPGFTIVETLIVLAVTGLLFVGAATLISGRQDKAMFAQSLRDIESRMQQMMSEVSTGYYPNMGDFNCISGGGEPVLSGGTAKQQGSNKDCIFLGKVVQFAVDAPDSSTTHAYSLIGLRQSGAGAVTSLADSRPRVIARGATDAASVPNVFDQYTLPYGMSVSYMRYNNTQPIGAIGFVSRLGATLGATDTSQQVDLVAFPGTVLGQSQAAAADSIKTSARTLPVAATNPTGGVQICLKSGTTEQSGLVTIGGEGRQLTITTSVKNTGNCT